MALTAGLFLFLAAIDADAAPIRPDIRKLVNESQATPPPAIPARAGWDGPEMQRRENRADAALDPSVTLRSNKAAILAAAVPDPRALFAVAVIIVLMRTLKQIEAKRNASRAEVVAFAAKERIAA